MVVPNGYHRMDCNVYKRRYPNLRVLAPRSSMARVSEVRGSHIAVIGFL
jgi:hypothetical protein